MNTGTDNPGDAGRIGVPGIAAVLAIVAAVVVLLVSTRGLLAAVFTAGVSAADSPQERERLAVEAYATAIDAHANQFNGRSILFVPGPPPPPPPPPAPVVENTDPPPPPPPATYGGPKLIGIADGLAWFDDGTKLGADGSKGDLKVLSLDAPWNVQVEWKGVAFAVSLFARDSVVIREAGAPPAAAAPLTPEELNPKPKAEPRPEPPPTPVQDGVPLPSQPAPPPPPPPR
ncbi:MAG: hypothetical protein ACKVU4_09920 [Phycisphaerales bacterium]